MRLASDWLTHSDPQQARLALNVSSALLAGMDLRADQVAKLPEFPRFRYQGPVPKSGTLRASESIGTGVDHLKVWPNLLGEEGQLEAAEIGHDDVGKQQVDLSWAPENLQCRLAPVCLNYSEVQRAHDLNCNRPNFVVIIHDQNGSSTSVRLIHLRSPKKDGLMRPRLTRADGAQPIIVVRNSLPPAT